VKVHARPVGGALGAVHVPRPAYPTAKNRSVFIKFNVDGLLRGDYESRMSGYATARQNGWMSANDIRELENLDRIPAELGGDLYLINGAMTKLQDAGAFANSTRNGGNNQMKKFWNWARDEDSGEHERSILMAQLLRKAWFDDDVTPKAFQS
jgi:hypothetical protein